MTDRAGKWLRVSTSGQDEESQHPDVQRYCDGRGYVTSAETTYQTRASAHKGNRRFDALWAQVLDDFRTGKINVLVVWRLTRLDRKLEATRMIQDVVKLGGRVEFSEQPHLNDLSTMGGRISLKVEEEIAFAESEEKSDRVRIKHSALRAAGSVVGRPPWGFIIEKRGAVKVFVPTAIGRKYIPLIFQSVIDGKSLREIAAWLEDEGVKPTRGERWNEAFIGNFLIKNPVYYGLRRNAGQLETEALVSPTIWQQANAALKSRVKGGRGPDERGNRQSHEKALLAPLCDVCYGREREGCPSGRSPLYRVYVPYADGKHAMYRCTGHGPQRKGCGAPMIPVIDLDATVTEAMLANQMWHTERTFIPGDDKSDAIARARERAAEAARQGDYSAMQEAATEAAALESEPRVAPHWETVTTEQTEADYFAALDHDERRAYLARFVITAQRVDDERGVVCGIMPREFAT